MNRHDTGHAQIAARYWPSGKVECPLTPAQAWRLRVGGELSLDGFDLVLRAWR